MAKPDHVDIVKQGTEAIRKWQIVFKDEHLYLREADLRTAHLESADLSGARMALADLSGVNLHNSHLEDIDLERANLSRANLSGAYIAKANLAGADLTGADLSGSILRSVNLNGAKLSGTRFQMASCAHLDLEFSDLSHSIGLDSIIHQAPSRIGFETLFRLPEKIPNNFLRGCGVPETIISHLPSLIGSVEPIQFYSCFLSYSHKDEDFAKRLHYRLQVEKLRVWFAPHDIKGGHKIHEQIEHAIRIHDKLLVVLSDASMISEWVKTEIAHARQREIKEGRRVLFPIRLVPYETVTEWKAFDADTGKDSA